MKNILIASGFGIMAVFAAIGIYRCIFFYNYQPEIIKTETATTTDYINTCNKQIEYKEIIVWDKIDECEKDGGDFYLYETFNDGEYTYYCEVDKETMRGSVDIKDIKKNTKQ